MEEEKKSLLKGINNEGAAIVGVVIIAIVSMFMLGIEAKDIPLALGSGLVGYIAKTVKEKI